MTHKIEIFLVGLAGTIYSLLMDITAFDIGRWIPIILSSAYVIWKWCRDIKKK